MYRASAHVHARVHPVGEGRTRGSARYEFLCTKVHVRNVIYRERSLGERVQGQMLERCSEVLCSWCVASFAECCQTHGYPLTHI